MQLNDVLYHLENENYISLESNDTYQLSNDLKDQLKSYENTESNSSYNKGEIAPILKENLSEEECQFKICDFLANNEMCKSDIERELIKITDMSRMSRKSLLKKSLTILESKGIIDSKIIDGKTYYYLNSDFKQDKIFENDLIQADYGFKPFEL